jgi:DNA repair protein RadC
MAEEDGECAMGNKVCKPLKNLPHELKPRERLYKIGPQSLSDIEVLAILLGTGTKGENVLDLASRILTEAGGISSIAGKSVHDFEQIRGIGQAKAAQVKAALEFGRRSARATYGQRPIISSPSDAASLIMEEMRFLDREHFRVMHLNTKKMVLGISEVSIGSLNSSLVHPRECFKEAIKRNSHSLILLHNHPSGDPTPSKEDLEITNRLIECGRILGILVLDHIIIGDGSYISLREKGII